MKFITSSIFRSLCSLLVGLLLLFNAQHMPALIIRVIGILFLLPGVFGILTYLISKFSKNAIIRPTFPLMSIGSVLLGAYLEVYPESFVTYLVILLGAMLILAGINQFLGMITNRKISPFSLLLMILPLVLIGIGGYCITHAYDAAETVFKNLDLPVYTMVSAICSWLCATSTTPRFMSESRRKPRKQNVGHEKPSMLSLKLSIPTKIQKDSPCRAIS